MRSVVGLQVTVYDALLVARECTSGDAAVIPAVERLLTHVDPFDCQFSIRLRTSGAGPV
jgi:hypothetical protein